MEINLRQYSRKDYSSRNTSGPTVEDINAGSLQRIADATELMASNHIQMEKDLKFYKNMYAQHSERIENLTRSNAALRGHITRLKKRLTVHYALFAKRHDKQPEDVKQK